MAAVNAPQIHPHPGETFRVVACPVHHYYYVSVDDDGRLLGRCDGCAREAALGIRRITAAARARAQAA